MTTFRDILRLRDLQERLNITNLQDLRLFMNILNSPYYSNYITNHGVITGLFLRNTDEPALYSDGKRYERPKVVDMPDTLEILGMNSINEDDCLALPRGLKKLWINHFNGDCSTLPPNLEELDIRYDILSHFYSKDLPKTLKYLFIHRSVSYEEKKLYISRMSDAYDNLVDNLPQSLLHLILPLNFDKPIDNLPCNLTHLSLGESFTYPLKNLPPTITHLTLNSNYDHDLQYLPNSITHLFFNMSEKQRCINIPRSVKYLFVNSYAFDYEYIIPTWLEILVINFHYDGTKDLTSIDDKFFNEKQINPKIFPKTIKYILIPSRHQLNDTRNRIFSEYNYVKLSNDQYWEFLKMNFSPILEHVSSSKKTIIFHIS